MVRVHGTIETASGERIVVRSETDGALSLIVERGETIVVATITLGDAANLGAALTLAIRDVGRGERSRTLLARRALRGGRKA